MASTRRRAGEVGVFFIYDHNRLKKEEDDLKDAILYFYPNYIPEDDKCLICGQLMGMAEFFLNTISKSPPKIFKLQNEKYCFKRVGVYSFVLEGRTDDADITLINHLDYLYNCFVLYCGSIDYIRQQYGEHHRGFIAELNAFWDILLPMAGYHDNHLYQVFQVLPSVELPKSGSELFLQSSNILQSSQRRPGVLVGTLMYKNKVLCSQMMPELTRKLILITPPLPCHDVKTDYELPVGVRLVSIFLTKDESAAVKPLYKNYNTHCKSSRFAWQNSDSQGQGQRPFSVSPRRFQKLENIPEKEASSLEDNAHSVENNSFKISQTQSIKSGVHTDTTSQKQTSSVQESFEKGRSLQRSSVPIIAISGEESTISDYEDDDKRDKSVQKQKIKFVKNGFKANSDKEIGKSRESFSIEDLEGSVASKKVIDITSKKETETSSKKSSKMAPAIEDFETQGVNEHGRQRKDSNNTVIIAADVHAHFEDSSGSDKKSEDHSLSENSGSPGEDDSKNVSDSEVDTSMSKENVNEKSCTSSDNQSTERIESSVDGSFKGVEHENDQSLKCDLSGIELQNESSKEDVSKMKSQVNSDLGDKELESDITSVSENSLSPDLSSQLHKEENVSQEFCEKSSNVKVKQNSSDIKSEGHFNESEGHLNECEGHLNEGESHLQNLQTSILQKEESIVEQIIPNDGVTIHNVLNNEPGMVHDNQTLVDSLNQSSKEIDIPVTIVTSDSLSEDGLGNSDQSYSTDKSSDQNLNLSALNVNQEKFVSELGVGHKDDDQNLTDQSTSVSPCFRGETTSPDSSTSDVASTEKKETLDFPLSDSHGVSADESASEMPLYGKFSNKQAVNSKMANQNSGYKHPMPIQLSIDSSLPESVSTQIGDSVDSLGSDRTLVSMEGQSWTSDIEGLAEVTMYVQRHCDISMILLMENDSVEDEKVVISLWKAALPHLADLDFYVKECTDAGINEAFLANQNFIQYDTFFQNIKGNVVQPLTGIDEEFHRLSATMHESFLNNSDMTDIIHRSHSSCCYGHRTVNNETYYQLRSNAVQASSLPSSKHPMFAMENLSAKELTKHNINSL